MSMRTTIKGGRKLKAFMRNAAAASRARSPTISAGFLEPHVATLAAQHEFGNPRSSLPERPAFRNAKEDALEAGKAEIAKGLGKRVASGRIVIDDGLAAKAAEAMVDVIQASYHEIEEPALSERQRLRKVGTLGAADVLVGYRGPKLIGHIQGRVTR